MATEGRSNFGQVTLSCSLQLKVENNENERRVALAGSGAFRVPCAQPLAFTEFHSTGAVLRISPRGDRVHTVLLLSLRASTLWWHSPLPTCLAQHPTCTECSYNALPVVALFRGLGPP